MKPKEKLLGRIQSGKHICVGLDSDIEKVPKHLFAYENPVLEFNKRIIDATKEHAAAYKLNFAFYEALGEKGYSVIKETLSHIPENILSIADAKRGDIGNTSMKYAAAIFDKLQFDSVTLAPYMGYDSIEPFLTYKEKIHFVLGLTSNKSAADFEKLKLENGKYLYQSIIEKLNEWNVEGNIGVVFGATKISELKENLDLLKNLIVLLPGVGAQGGRLSDIAETFFAEGLNNFIVNISRGIIFSDATESFDSIVKLKMEEFQEELN